jgi:hypothetical protein
MTLKDDVAAGHEHTVFSTVPAHESFTLTSFVLEATNRSCCDHNISTSGGQVRIERLVPGVEPEYLVVVGQSQLYGAPALTAKLTTPIPFGPGDAIGLQVKCASGGKACHLKLSFKGTFRRIAAVELPRAAAAAASAAASAALRIHTLIDAIHAAQLTALAILNSW